MLKAGNRNRELEQIAFARVRIHVHNAFGLFEWQAVQKEIVDQAEDSGVQTNPERKRENGDEGERRRLPKFPKSETQIAHEDITRCAVLELDRQVWRGGRATSKRGARWPRAKWSRRRAVRDCGPTLQRVATKVIARARMRRRCQSQVRSRPVSFLD